MVKAGGSFIEAITIYRNANFLRFESSLNLVASTMRRSPALF